MSSLRIVVSLVALVLFACDEDRHGRYRTHADLVNAGPGPQSWFPPSTPVSAVDLEEWHNIDSNNVVGRFRLPCGELVAFTKSLRPVAFEPRTFQNMEGWPQCLSGRVDAARLTSCRMRAYIDGEMTVVVDGNQCGVYFWN